MSSGDVPNPDAIDICLMRKLMGYRGLKRYLDRSPKLDSFHDIPYLVGYSVDGSTIYVDRDIPAGFERDGRWINTYSFLQIHAKVEKAVLDALRASDRTLYQLLGITRQNPDDVEMYFKAHGVGQASEDYAVATAMSAEERKGYNVLLRHYGKGYGDPGLRKLPQALDMAPYRPAHPLDRADYCMVDALEALMV